MRTIPATTLVRVATLLSLGTAACRGSSTPAFQQLAEARRLADDLRIQLAKTSNASDRAVMADTDEESIAFARDAEKAASAIALDTASLGARLQSLDYAAEGRMLDDFGGHFTEYRQVDRDVLDLAVQNTNLKAQRLSFGPLRETADQLHDALAAAVTAAAPKDRCRVDGLVARAELAVREIQILQAPHIAEADDAAMTKMEKEMADRQATAREALKLLGWGATAVMTKNLDAAKTALDQFDRLSAELVTLSRRNSNVRSVALALRRTPALVAACDVNLTQLQDALAKEGFTGTR